MGVTMQRVLLTKRRSPMDVKVEHLRNLIEEVEVVSIADLARRWGVTHEGARKFMNGEGAPSPLPLPGSTCWALPEVERYRSTRLLGSR